jgi:hypothetical protein
VILLAKLGEGTLDEVGAVVGDDVVRKAIVVDELANELGGGLAIAISDSLGLNPLGEVVDRDQQMIVLVP